MNVMKIDKKYKLAIFDMDGTILNTIADITDAVNYALKEYNLPEKSLSEITTYVGNGAARLVELATPEGTSLELNKMVYELYCSYYHTHSEIKTCPYDGIIELLKKLKEAGFLTAVVSNKPDAGVKKLADKYFTGLFDVAIGENEALGIARKPAPDEVELALSGLRIKKEDAVYIGDSDVDMATAANSGLDMIAVSWGFKGRNFLQNKGADVIVDTPEEIFNYLLS